MYIRCALPARARRIYAWDEGWSFLSFADRVQRVRLIGRWDCEVLPRTALGLGK